jgi:CBS domain containing-hemolysin-like protein
VPLFLEFVALVVLVGFSGLMAASEAALGVLSSDDIRDLSRSGRPSPALAAIADDMPRHLTVTTFVRVICETAAVVVITTSLVLSAMPAWVSIFAAFAVAIAVSFVLVGSSPRSVGRVHATAVLRAAAPSIHFFRLVLGPLAQALVAMGNRVTPGRPGASPFASEEQLLSMVDEAVRHDVLEDDDRELIHSVIEWGDTLVREVMVPRLDMVTVEGTLSLDAALAVFYESGHSRIPVIGEDLDDVLGVLNLRDVTQLSFESGGEESVRTAASLARPVLFVPESKKADDALRQLQEESSQIALVVDEYGGIAGLITSEDLLEELVGDIGDEYDRAGTDAEDLGSGRYRVAARLPVDELGELFGLELSDDDVDSVGGLLAKELGHVPVVGDSVTVSGLILRAERADARRRRITHILAEANDDLVDAQRAFPPKED